MFDPEEDDEFGMEENIQKEVMQRQTDFARMVAKLAGEAWQAIDEGDFHTANSMYQVIGEFADRLRVACYMLVSAQSLEREGY